MSCQTSWFCAPLVLLGQFIKVGPGKAGGIRRAGPKTRSAHDRSQVSKLGAMIVQSSYRVFVRFGKRKQAPWGKKAPAVAGASHLCSDAPADTHTFDSRLSMIVDAVRRYHQFQRHVRALEVMDETCGRKLGLFSEAASSRGTVHDRLRTFLSSSTTHLSTPPCYLSGPWCRFKCLTQGGSSFRCKKIA